MAAEHYIALSEFSHKAGNRTDFQWDLAQASWINDHLDDFEEVELKNQVTHFASRFAELQNAYQNLPKAIIHNDMNDYNTLVTKGRISGFIDYGDMCYSQRINDVAILLAYAVMDEVEPVDACIHLLRGYTSVCPLMEEEIDCLYVLVAMRLCVSLVSSNLAIKKDPENRYLLISQLPALGLLEKWYNGNEKLATYRFKVASGLPLVKLKEEFTAWLESNEIAMVCPMQVEDYITLDLGVGSTELGHESYFNDAVKHENQINQLLSEAGKSFAIGSFDEVRPLYSSDDFTELGNEGQRWRTVHIGLDFFQQAGTEVYAFAKGLVHSLNYNEGDKNYGNTLIIKHEGFYTLYGHLASNTLEHVRLGQEVAAGDLIAWFGEPHENGNWAPHLHFQIILDMLDYTDDYPGVCHFDQREVWTQLCPDPRPLLGIEVMHDENLNASDILKVRKKNLGKSYSLSYQEPLHILRAHGQYLYDETGRKFLDCVNNVPHVGHQNITVVEAAMAQMQLLNTNTRYLHENIVRLADRLTRTLPPQLKVCHFVNSGSEANELAIRMARVATGRNGIVAMEHGYHGNTNLCVDISSYKFNGKGGQGQKDFVQLVQMPDPLRNASGTPFQLDNKKETPACFIHESILSCGGQVVMPGNFYADLYTQFRAKGVVMIADEVQTGLGRIGSHMWAFEAEGITPDIVTIGKPFGNGHPLAAVVCTEEIAQAFHNGMEYFNTFGGNPVSCAIGLGVLDEIEEKGLQLHAFDLGQYIKEELEKFRQEHPFIADVRGRGLFLGWEFADPKTQEPLASQASFFVSEMKRYGVLLSTDGPLHNVIKFKPPMVFTRANADYMLGVMKKVISNVEVN
jgi:4-aminobutyrate aminotransferase-like enzyme